MIDGLWGVNITEMSKFIVMFNMILFEKQGN